MKDNPNNNFKVHLGMQQNCKKVKSFTLNDFLIIVDARWNDELEAIDLVAGAHVRHGRGVMMQFANLFEQKQIGINEIGI